MTVTRHKGFLFLPTMFNKIVKITKNYILQEIADIDIWAYYSGVSASTIENCLHYGKTICSPLRTDNNPSFGFYRSKNNYALRGNDFAGYFHGDCFDLVGNNYYLNANDPIDFNKILMIIAKDFNLLKSENKLEFTKIKSFEKENKETLIDVRTNGFSSEGQKYWQNLNVNLKLLEKHFVFEVAELFINNTCIYTSVKNKLAFAYYITETTKIEWKVYFPFKDKGFKFLSNSSSMWGLDFIQKAEYGIIAKSSKDALFFKSIGLESVALFSESKLPEQHELEIIQKNWNNIIVMTDFDLTGIKLVNKLKKLITIKYAFLTNGKFNTVNYKAKDITDFVLLNGVTNTINLIKWWKSENI